MEILQAQCALIQSYGITITEPQQAIILLANVQVGALHDYGQEFRPALETIRREFKYSYTHDTAFIKKILAECAVSSAVHKLQDAPEPGGMRETASAVENLTGLFNRMMDDSESEYEGTAASTVYQSDSSSERLARKPKKRAKEANKKPKKERRGRSKSRGRDRDNFPADWKDNPCKHCCKNK